MKDTQSQKNSTPKMVWFRGMSPHVWSWYRWLNTCLLYCYWHLLMLFVAYHMLSSIVEFILLFFVCSYYFELTDDTYSVHVASYWALLTYDFWFPSALASLPHIKFQGELYIQDCVGFSRSWHDVLCFRTHTIFLFWCIL